MSRSPRRWLEFNVRALKSIYDFITGGSIVTPVFLAAAILAAFFLPAFRPEAFLALVALAFIASTFERTT